MDLVDKKRCVQIRQFVGATQRFVCTVAFAIEVGETSIKVSGHVATFVEGIRCSSRECSGREDRRDSFFDWPGQTAAGGSDVVPGR